MALELHLCLYAVFGLNSHSWGGFGKLKVVSENSNIDFNVAPKTI